MVNIAIVDLAKDNIEYVYEDAAPNQSRYGGAWGWPDATVHLAIPEGLDTEVAGVTKQPDGSYVFGIDQAKYEAKEAKKWVDLRAERNKRLSKCDWTQLPDTSLTDAQKQAWSEYRQALRDLPSNTVDTNNIVWPIEPTA